MRQLMLISVLLASSPVVADTALRPVVDLGTLDARCRPLASAPSNARTPGLAFDAYISIANCEVLAHTHALALTTTPASRDALDHAVRPSLKLLDYVIKHGDLAHQIIAQHAKADTYQGIAVQLANTVPRPSTMTSDMAIDDYHQKVMYADKLTLTWRQRSEQARREVARLASHDVHLVATHEWSGHEDKQP
jgi:hypothetical protein